MFDHKNFAEIEPIVVLSNTAAIPPEEYDRRASAWLKRTARMLTEKRDAAYDEDGIREENDLRFTQREIDFLIDGLERLERKFEKAADIGLTEAEN
ncbi:hypothetical protein ATN81_11660 [Agrobacterium pusense]|uniref:hypothetical protein n=1 Tax=Agrobacterium pusense TaxID=648995 RepID=UPI000929CAB5|nr:hypothetical protein [Agrobacterium pusense]OJH54908.1 hypothetical protein ATN81_11660 [Agrobacterium pusense]OJH59260.1 hypothetical protein BA725_13255 [Agrobacterium pusense]